MINKTMLGLVVALVVGGGIFYFSRPVKAPSDGAIEPESNMMPVPGETVKEKEVNNDEEATMTKEIVVEIVAGAFSPANVTVTKNTKVTFVNKDTAPHWPASAPHPQHTCYPGFDALKGLSTGEKFSFIASVAKTCNFHDHLNPSIHGLLTVTE